MYNCVVLHPFNSFTDIIMLTWLYELLMTFVAFVLSLVGIQMNKKSVSFTDEVENKDVAEVSDTGTAVPDDDNVTATE
jgi:hypothetical protein